MLGYHSSCIKAKMLRPTGAALWSNRETGRGDSVSSAWHVDSGTDGSEGPYGVERASKLSIGIVYLHERKRVFSCACVC